MSNQTTKRVRASDFSFEHKLSEISPMSCDGSPSITPRSAAEAGFNSPPMRVDEGSPELRQTAVNDKLPKPVQHDLFAPTRQPSIFDELSPEEQRAVDIKLEANEERERDDYVPFAAKKVFGRPDAGGIFNYRPSMPKRVVPRLSMECFESSPMDKASPQRFSSVNGVQHTMLHPSPTARYVTPQINTMSTPYRVQKAPYAVSSSFATPRSLDVPAEPVMRPFVAPFEPLAEVESSAPQQAIPETRTVYRPEPKPRRDVHGWLNEIFPSPPSLHITPPSSSSSSSLFFSPDVRPTVVTHAHVISSVPVTYGHPVNPVHAVHTACTYPTVFGTDVTNKGVSTVVGQKLFVDEPRRENLLPSGYGDRLFPDQVRQENLHAAKFYSPSRVELPGTPEFGMPSDELDHARVATPMLPGRMAESTHEIPLFSGLLNHPSPNVGDFERSPLQRGPYHPKVQYWGRPSSPEVPTEATISNKRSTRPYQEVKRSSPDRNKERKLASTERSSEHRRKRSSEHRRKKESFYSLDELSAGRTSFATCNATTPYETDEIVPRRLELSPDAEVLDSVSTFDNRSEESDFLPAEYSDSGDALNQQGSVSDAVKSLDDIRDSIAYSGEIEDPAGSGEDVAKYCASGTAGDVYCASGDPQEKVARTEGDDVACAIDERQEEFAEDVRGDGGACASTEGAGCNGGDGASNDPQEKVTEDMEKDGGVCASTSPQEKVAEDAGGDGGARDDPRKKVTEDAGGDGGVRDDPQKKVAEDTRGDDGACSDDPQEKIAENTGVCSIGTQHQFIGLPTDTDAIGERSGNDPKDIGSRGDVTNLDSGRDDISVVSSNMAELLALASGVQASSNTSVVVYDNQSENSDPLLPLVLGESVRRVVEGRICVRRPKVVQQPIASHTFGSLMRIELPPYLSSRLRLKALNTFAGESYGGQRRDGSFTYAIVRSVGGSVHLNQVLSVPRFQFSFVQQGSTPLRKTHMQLWNSVDKHPLPIADAPCNYPKPRKSKVSTSDQNRASRTKNAKLPAPVDKPAVPRSKNPSYPAPGAGLPAARTGESKFLAPMADTPAVSSTSKPKLPQPIAGKPGPARTKNSKLWTPEPIGDAAAASSTAPHKHDANVAEKPGAPHTAKRKLSVNAPREPDPPPAAKRKLTEPGAEEPGNSRAKKPKLAAPVASKPNVRKVRKSKSIASVSELAAYPRTKKSKPPAHIPDTHANSSIANPKLQKPAADPPAGARAKKPKPPVQISETPAVSSTANPKMPNTDKPATARAKDSKSALPMQATALHSGSRTTTAKLPAPGANKPSALRAKNPKLAAAVVNTSSSHTSNNPESLPMADRVVPAAAASRAKRALADSSLCTGDDRPLARYKVLCDFDGASYRAKCDGALQKGAYLSLRAGDVVTQLRPSVGGELIFGRFRRKKGYFPGEESQYVALLEDSAPKRRRSDADATAKSKVNPRAKSRVTPRAKALVRHNTDPPSSPPSSRPTKKPLRPNRGSYTDDMVRSGKSSRGNESLIRSVQGACGGELHGTFTTKTHLLQRNFVNLGKGAQTMHVLEGLCSVVYPDNYLKHLQTGATVYLPKAKKEYIALAPEQCWFLVTRQTHCG